MDVETDWSSTKVITPKVDETREFLEIATDFANPLDIVREAISNSFDARSKLIRIRFEVIQKYGDYILKILIEDNGTGMNEEELAAFFDLGRSPRRMEKEKDSAIIGEKGHGTKIYFNSERIDVTTAKNGQLYSARMERPFARLYEGEIPTVEVKSKLNEEGFEGTKIEIEGYNKNRRDLFNHDRLRDHILWFTKHGSVENQFGIALNEGKVLYLQGVDRKEEEAVVFGHPFPEESDSVEKLFDKHLAYAPDFFCKKWCKTGQLPDFPDIQYQAIFCVEGDKVKRDYNSMLRRRGMPYKQGSYQVQERYGLWLCKDYIPIQRKNEWITTKGSEFTKFHAFLNCQALRLTANRGSVENTPSEILQNIERVVRDIYNDVLESDDWSNLEYLEQAVSAYQTEEKEKKDYEKRVKRARAARVASYKSLTLIEPRQENGVYALVVALQAIEPSLLPFDIVDYDTHSGIDVLGKTRDNVDVGRSNLRYIEFKHTLTDSFSHSFRYLHSIVCWKSQIEHDQSVTDISGAKRRMIITPRPAKAAATGPEQANDSDYTRFMLDDPKEPHKIEVFVLEEYLNERLGISFSSRPSG